MAIRLSGDCVVLKRFLPIPTIPGTIMQALWLLSLLFQNVGKGGMLDYKMNGFSNEITYNILISL
jgi:hypothetical protein